MFPQRIRNLDRRFTGLRLQFRAASGVIRLASREALRSRMALPKRIFDAESLEISAV